MDPQSSIDSILFQQSRIGQLKAQVKTQRESIADHVESSEEWFQVREAQEELARRKEALRLKLMQDRDYSGMMDTLDELKRDLRETTDLLSDLVVAHRVETREDVIEAGDGEGRRIILKGKLSRPEKYQPSLFSASSDTIESSNNKEG